MRNCRVADYPAKLDTTEPKANQIIPVQRGPCCVIGKCAQIRAIPYTQLPEALIMPLPIIQYRAHA